MQTLNKPSITSIVSDSFEKSMNYTEYRDLVSELAVNNSTTGNEKTEALANYTMLNDRRMKRWDKTVKLSDEAKTTIENYDKDVTWLVLTESWCGDAAHLMPVMNKVAALNERIDFKVVLRDDNEALMNEFLTNGGKAIPKLIMIDNKKNKVITSYGPRPSTATEMVNNFKAEHGQLTAEFKEDLQCWYNKDKGQTTLKDLLDLLS